VVTLSGDLDLGATSTLHRLLTSSSSATNPHVVIDLGLVDFMDCSALGTFVWAHRRAKNAGGCLRIVNAQPGPAKLLAASGLSEVFCLYSTLGAATGQICLMRPHSR